MPLPRERLERLIARSTDIVVATDRKGTVIYYNDGAKKTLGYNASEVLGSFVANLAQITNTPTRSHEANSPGLLDLVGAIGAVGPS